MKRLTVNCRVPQVQNDTQTAQENEQAMSLCETED